jgi:TfoX/Sxy family transcriptional regulator of competence genes
MATRANTVDHLLDALAPLPLSTRKMFGEYALYLDGKVVAFVCDDLLYLKPTPGAQTARSGCPTGHPYPGAKPHCLATDALVDQDYVSAAPKAIAAGLSAPKPKTPKTQVKLSFPLENIPREVWRV